MLSDTPNQVVAQLPDKTVDGALCHQAGTPGRLIVRHVADDVRSTERPGRGPVVTLSKTDRKAFTLVEILIVVVILGVLAAIVVPQFTSAAAESRKNSLLGHPAFRSAHIFARSPKTRSAVEIPSPTRASEAATGTTTN